MCVSAVLLLLAGTLLPAQAQAGAVLDRVRAANWATLVSPPTPFHAMRYAYAVRPGDRNWLAMADGFVARIQRDGRLAAAAQRPGLGALVRRR